MELGDNITCPEEGCDGLVKLVEKDAYYSKLVFTENGVKREATKGPFRDSSYYWCPKCDKEWTTKEFEEEYNLYFNI